MEYPRVVDALPTLTRALRGSLLREGESALAAQLEEARIYALCECGRVDCMSFYTMPPADDQPGVGEYRVVLPDAVNTVGVRDGRMTFIEDDPAGSEPPDPSRAREYRALVGVVRRHVPPDDGV